MTESAGKYIKTIYILSDEEAIEKILEAIRAAGFEPGRDFTTDELIAHWEGLVDKYPIISIEDGLDEEDWEGWKKKTEKIGSIPRYESF